MSSLRVSTAKYTSTLLGNYICEWEPEIITFEEMIIKMQCGVPICNPS
jgi:hypothetical protein